MSYFQRVSKGNKYLKSRALATFLAIQMVLVAIPVYATSTPSVVLDSVQMSAEREAIVSLKAKDIPEPGLAGYFISISYTASAIESAELKGVTVIKTSEDKFATPVYNQRSGRVDLAAAQAQGPSGDVSLAHLKFKVKSGVNQDIPLTVSVQEMVGSDAKGAIVSYSPTTVNGKILIGGSGTSSSPGMEPAPSQTTTQDQTSLPTGGQANNQTGIGQTSGEQTANQTVTDQATGGQTTNQTPANQTQANSTTSPQNEVTAIKPFYIEINDLPIARVDSAYTYQLTASGGTAPYLWSADNLPAGLKIDPGTGVISGTPLSSAGSDLIRVTVKDSSNPARTVQAEINLEVANPIPNPNPTTAANSSSNTAGNTVSVAPTNPVNPTQAGIGAWASSPAGPRSDSGSQSAAKPAANPNSALSAPKARVLAGANRYMTSIAIANTHFSAAQVRNIFLANAYAPADALAGAPLAFKMKAPIVLTTEDLNQAESFKDYAKQLKDVKLNLLGGSGVLGGAYEQYDPQSSSERFGGENRRSTAVKIARELVGSSKGTPVVVVNENDFVDAISIAPIAAQKGWPILLTEGTELSSEVKEFIEFVQPSSIVVIGGEGVVSDGVYKNLGALTREIKRLGGQDRFETNAKVLREYAGSTDKVAFANGDADDVIDALAGAALGIPIVLVHEKEHLNAEQQGYLQNVGKVESLVFGGSGVINPDISW